MGLMDQWTNGLGESNEMALDASLFASPESFIRRNPSFLRLSSHIMFSFLSFCCTSLMVAPKI